MQKINRAIINPPFMLIFFGPLLLQIISAFLYRDASAAFWVILASAVIYGAGTLMVTGMGNVPLNDALDTLSLPEMSEKQIADERQQYEVRWNRLHTIRTVFAVLSFMLILLAALLPL
jgi:uncharacterized membrane protein